MGDWAKASQIMFVHDLLVFVPRVTGQMTETQELTMGPLTETQELRVAQLIMMMRRVMFVH
jgi:hypothetical protein